LPKANKKSKPTPRVFRWGEINPVPVAVVKNSKNAVEDRDQNPHDGCVETFEKCSILFKFKAGENFNHPDEIGTGIHTLSILRIKI